MKKLLAYCLTLLLFGCATPEVVRVERVDVPVPVPCVKLADVQDIPRSVMRADGDIRAHAAAAAADIYALQAYAERARAMLLACAAN